MTQQPPERDGLSEEGVLHGKHIELLLVIERDLARALSGATEVDEVLRLSLKAGMDATGLQCGGVYLVDSESNVLRLECHAGLSPEFIREVAVFGPNTDEFRLVALAEVAQIDSQSNPPPAFLSARRAGMQAVIVVPVIHDGRPIGSMNLGSPTLNRIAPSVRHVLDTIASQMCVALVRVRSEAAHRSVQAELRAIYDGSPTMMCVLDRDLRLQYLNRTMAEFIGKNEKELQHQRACGIIGCINALDDPRGCGHGPKCEACTMRLAMINTLHTGESHRGVERRMTLMRGESQNDVVLLGATVLIPSRAGASLLLCLEDITERKRTEDALQESEMKFRQLIERSSDVFYRQSLRSGLFEYISPKVHALLGYTPDEVMNLDLEMQEAQIHPDDIESLARFSIDLVQADEEGQPCIEREFRLRNKQGTYRWLHGNYALVRDSDGSPHLIVGSLRDVTERKQAEEHLRLKSLVLDQISDHVTVTDLNGRITYVNQAQVDTLQRSSRELIGQPTELFGEDACRGATQQQIVELTLRNGSWRGEVVNYAADGSERIMDCRTQVILAADGIPIALAGVATDITRRRLTEDALRESQARLAESNQLLTAVLEHTHMMAVFLDPRFNFVWVNRAYADTCRHEPSYFPGKNHFHLYPNEENKAIFQRVADTGRPFFVAAKPFVFPDQPERGTTYWDWSLIPVKDADGKVAGLVFTLAEVTERFRAEAALRHEKSYTESILRSMADMLVVVAPDGSIVTVNESTCRTSGYRERDLLGQPATLLLEEEEEEEEDPNVTLASHALPVKRSLLRHLIIRGFVTGIQGSMRTKHGRQVPVVFSGAVMYGTQNEIRGIVCLLRDITTRIENEAKLRSLESQLNHAARLASLGELAAGIAHEVNQPLCSIVNYAKACTNLASSDQAQDLGQIREWADMIAATAADTGDIVRRVIHFARRSLPDREEFRLRELVDDAILLVSQEAQARGVMITTSIPKNGVSVHVQSVAVQQVLVNVLRNSIEALGTMPSMDRRIHIGAAPFDRLVEVVVSDNGPGLPEDQRASIFEPFVTTKPQGLGLGLSICRTIVEEHGGSIWVTARDMGGAIVHFTLPARPG